MEMRKAAIAFVEGEVLVVFLVSVSGVGTGSCMIGGREVRLWSSVWATSCRVTNESSVVRRFMSGDDMLALLLCLAASKACSRERSWWRQQCLCE